jgi:hypothetical protein
VFVAVGNGDGVLVAVAVLVDVLVEVKVGVGLGIGEGVGMTTVMPATELVVASPVCRDVLVGRTLNAYSPGLSKTTSPTHTPSLPTVTVCTTRLLITISNTLLGAPVPVSVTRPSASS